MNKTNTKLLDNIRAMVLAGKGYREIKAELHTSNRQITKVKNALKEALGMDVDLIIENVRYSKKVQMYQDVNRVERKAFREHARIENSVVAYTTELIKVLKSHKLPVSKNATGIEVKGKAAIVHLTDLHLNELVNLSCNKYDFQVAAKRLKKYAINSKKYLKANGVKTVLIAMTGDLLNSDRRTDELLSEATNRAKATILAVILIRQFIEDFTKDYSVSVANVIGNESRITKDVGWTDAIATDNYDFTIFNILKLLFEKTSVDFIADDNSLERVVNLAGQNVLLLHGNQLKGNLEQAIQKIKGKYSAQDTIINFVIFGHLHSARIGDGYARGSSLVGANGYSDSALQLESRASQNVHIFYDDGSRDSIKIDLQNTDGIKGYEIIKDLETYNAKSIKKAFKKQRIAKVII